jgi:hypothetical protein
MCLPVRRNPLTRNWRYFLGRIYHDEKNYEAGCANSNWPRSWRRRSNGKPGRNLDDYSKQTLCVTCWSMGSSRFQRERDPMNTM